MSDELASLANQQFRATNDSEASWRKDGKLHFSTALEWQQASFQNKRATSSDFLLALHKQGLLNIDISDNEKLKMHSEALTTMLNQYFEMIGPAVENTKKYENKRVSDAVVLITSQNGSKSRLK
ncbi:hypothetical protein D210916BOD24_17560 [Alteromonas sp. D210916BOD_24]